MSWFSKLVPSKIRTVGGNKRTVPEGLWIKCDGCSAVLYRSELERSLDVCPKCSHHMRIGARRRLQIFLDDDSGKEIAAFECVYGFKPAIKQGILRITKS